MEQIVVTGMILQTTPIGESDRRVVILTKDRGKISAFARGARKPHSQLIAATNPFSFGEFSVYAGRSSYTLVSANISNYFSELRSDMQGAYYGFYFLEVANYFGYENSDAKEMLRLLYQTLRALNNTNIPNELVRDVYELRTITLEGEGPQEFASNLSQSAAYAMNYIMTATIEKLYSFMVTKEVLAEITYEVNKYFKKRVEHEFKALQILESIL
jgi:DNA repair protein RecO (recombination protein O)